MEQNNYTKNDVILIGDSYGRDYKACQSIGVDSLLLHTEYIKKESEKLDTYVYETQVIPSSEHNTQAHTTTANED